MFVGLQWSVVGSNWFWDLVCPFKFQTKNILSGPHIFNPSQLHLIEVCNWCAILGYREQILSEFQARNRYDMAPIGSEHRK